MIFKHTLLEWVIQLVYVEWAVQYITVYMYLHVLVRLHQAGHSVM